VITGKPVESSRTKNRNKLSQRVVLRSAKPIQPSLPIGIFSAANSVIPYQCNL